MYRNCLHLRASDVNLRPFSLYLYIETQLLKLSYVK